MDPAFWQFVNAYPGWTFLICLVAGGTIVGIVRGIGSWFHPTVVCDCCDDEPDDKPKEAGVFGEVLKREGRQRS